MIMCYMLGMLMMYLATVDKYDVVYEMDPTLTPGEWYNNSNGKLFSGLILSVIVVSLTVFCYVEKSKKWKWATGIMCVLALWLYFTR